MEGDARDCLGVLGDLRERREDRRSNPKERSYGEAVRGAAGHAADGDPSERCPAKLVASDTRRGRYRYHEADSSRKPVASISEFLARVTLHLRISTL